MVPLDYSIGGRMLVPLGAAVLSASFLAQIQTPIKPNEPPPAGQRIEARDGDTVVIPGGARVRIVRRTEGTVRILYNAANRWLAILYDVGDASTPPDGKVDGSYRFDDVDGVWPLGERWQGNAVIDDYQMTQGLIRVGLGVTTDAGLFQFFSGSPAAAGQWFRDSRAAAVLSYRSGGGGGMPSRMSFDQAEQFVAQDAAHQAEMREAAKSNPSLHGGFSSNVSMSAESGSGGIKVTPTTGNAPVRVGGNIAVPKKITDVRPVYPPDAQAARIQGVVIIEATIAPDGTVGDARVLRSIPQLDQAAVDAVRQWRFTPTVVNGVAVPVIMTVTVNFSMQ
jgi:TonB family protein